MRSRRLRRRYGRSGASAESLFHSAEAAFRRGRDALSSGDVDLARSSAIEVGNFALKANAAGLDPKRYGAALRAQRILIDRIGGS